jgi:3-oxoacyl-[acyl-carrier-protein] synthase III
MFNFESINIFLGEESKSIEELAAIFGKDSSKYLDKTGFKALHRTNLSLEEFAKSSLKKWGASITNSVVIVVNQSDQKRIPGLAPRILVDLDGNESALYYELSDGCTGYIRALGLAETIFKAGHKNKIFIICVEKYSNLIPLENINLSSLFSDSISISTLTAEPIYKITKSLYKNNFKESNCLEVSPTAGELEMNGARIFTWAISEIPLMVQELLLDSNLGIEEIDHWYIHQGSKIIVESIKQNLAIDKPTFYSSETGNLVASSIALGLSRDIKNYKTGEKSILLGFGIGLSAYGMMVEKIA